MPFEKGKSGNPTGRPKDSKEVREVKELAKKASLPAIKRLIELLDSQNESISIKAAESILDRAIGKPAQTHGFDQDNPLQVALQGRIKIVRPNS